MSQKNNDQQANTNHNPQAPHQQHHHPSYHNQQNNSNYYAKRNKQIATPYYAQGYMTGNEYAYQYGSNFYPPQYYLSAQQYPVYGQPQPSSPHPLNVTTQSGEKIELKQLNSHTPKATHSSLNRSSISTPKTPSAIPSGPTHQRTPSNASAATNAAANLPKADSKAEELKEKFKQQVLARAQAKKDAEKRESASSTSTSTPAEKGDENKESSNGESSTSAPAPTPTPATANSDDENTKTDSSEVKESTTISFKESVVSKASAVNTQNSQKEEVEDVVKEATDLSKEESKEVLADSTEDASVDKTEPAVKEILEEGSDSKSDHPEASETRDQLDQPKEIESVLDAKDSEIAEEQVSSEEVPTAADAATSDFTISSFLSRLENAKPIEDPFKFSYPAGFVGPSERLIESGPALRYDPPFLMQFKDKCTFPMDDKFREAIQFIQISPRGADRTNSSRNFKFGQGNGISGTAGFSKSGSNLRKFDPASRSNSRQNSKRRGASSKNDRKSNRTRERDYEREPEMPTEPVKPLEKSANRWVPRSQQRKTEEVKYAPDGVTVILSPEDVTRKTKSLLNKLTLEHFDAISDNIIAIANQSQWEETSESLISVLNSIFEKATDEPHWSAMYAQLCAKMFVKTDPSVKNVELTGSDGEPLSGGVLFRRLLLSKCQAEYERGWSDKLPTNEDGTPIEPELMTDEYYKAAAAKRRGLGLVRFIGHLYVLNLLSENIIFICLLKLIENTADPSEDTVENLVQLVKTVGARLDNSPNPNSKLKFNDVFTRIQTMIDGGKLSSRLEFALIDLVDLKKANWIGGEAEKGPKTIAEIHEEEAKKAAEDQRAQTDRRRQGKSDSRSNSSRNAGWGSSNRVLESDISRVGRGSNPSSSSNLGPMNNFSRQKSLRSTPSVSSVPSNASSTRPAESREPSKRAESNRFNALMDGQNDEDDVTEEVTATGPKPEDTTNA